MLCSPVPGMVMGSVMLPLIVVVLSMIMVHAKLCLLYTSDAADERSSVDLGGRRIIKKKNDGEQASLANRTIISQRYTA